MIKIQFLKGPVRFNIFLTLALGILCASIAVSSCSPQYRIYKQENGIARFSFEYSSKYAKEVIDLSNEAVSLIFSKTGKDSGSFTLFGFFNFEPGMLSQSSNDYTNSELNSAMKYEDFHLLANTEFNFKGVLGHKLIYSYKRGKSVDFPAPNNPVEAIETEVIFEQKGLIWSIWIDGPTSEEQTINTDFAKILDTFTILN